MAADGSVDPEDSINIAALAEARDYLSNLMDFLCKPIEALQTEYDRDREYHLACDRKASDIDAPALPPFATGSDTSAGPSAEESWYIGETFAESPALCKDHGVVPETIGILWAIFDMAEDELIEHEMNTALDEHQLDSDKAK